MKTDTFTKEFLILRNVNKEDYRDIHVYLADMNPEGSFPRWSHVEEIVINEYETVIKVYDINRPVYYELSDGTRRKIQYYKKK